MLEIDLAFSGSNGAGYGAAKEDTGPPAVIAAISARGTTVHARLSELRFAKVLMVSAIVWLGPLTALLHFAGSTSVLSIAVFYSKMAVVTFGGAYAMFAHMAQQAVSINWPVTVLASMAFLATFRFKTGMLTTFVACSALCVLYSSRFGVP